MSHSEQKKAAQAVCARLLQMRQHWQDAAKDYFEPDRFLLAVQSCITVSRTVTFILQSNKAEFKNFEDWYEAQQVRWRADPIMTWARDARNAIEKQGDLRTHSQVRATVIANYLDGAHSQWLPQQLFASPIEVFRTVPINLFTAHTIENGTLLIERRWVDEKLPERELLDALAYVYGDFCATINDLLKRQDVSVESPPPEDLPRSMQALAMDRAIYLSMRDGSPRGFRTFQKPLRIQDKQRKVLERRYGKNVWEPLSGAQTFREVAIAYFNVARTMTLRDNHHRSFTFFLRDNCVIEIVATDHPDRASRYVLMRDLAKLAVVVGANGVFLINEAWTAKPTDFPEGKYPVDAANRGEALTMGAANDQGLTLAFTAPIRRKKVGKGKIKSLGETLVVDDPYDFILLPFLREWGCLDPQKLKAMEAGFDTMLNPTRANRR